MRRLVLLAICFFFLPDRSFAQKEPEADQSIPAHDIDSYDKAGPYELKRGADGELPKGHIDKERNWLWEHWKEKKLGLLMETSYSIEGDRASFFYFVESDTDGNWRIGVRIERVNVDRKNLGCEHSSMHTYSAYSVTRVERKRDAKRNHVPIAIDENRPARDYLLRFEDKNGKELILF